MDDSARRQVSPKLRFEVFKRDSFRCQYCGLLAPDVILEVDHIEPHKLGGSADILNLVTSCRTCNRGKGAVSLDDQTVLAKRRTQLEALQERREQIDMMLRWYSELSDLSDYTVDQAAQYWTRLTGLELVDHALNELRRHLDSYGLDIVLAALDVAVKQYCKPSKRGGFTARSVDIAFSRIGSICWTKKQEKSDPYLRDLYYIRKILRNRLDYLDERSVLSLTRTALEYGYRDFLIDIAKSVRSWSDYRLYCEEIEPKKT